MSYLSDRAARKNGTAPPLPTKKERKPIAKVSKKRKAENQALMEIRGGGDSLMDKFFLEMRGRMKGKCLFCNAPTMKKDDEKFHYSIAHLLPKRPVDKGGFPSVGTNEDNWIELCFWGENCHGNFDSGMITWEFIKDSKEWEIIKEKLLLVLPMVAESERKNKLYSKLIDLVYAK